MYITAGTIFVLSMYKLFPRSVLSLGPSDGRGFAFSAQPFDDGDSNATKWKKTQGWRAAQAERGLPTTAHDAEVKM